jgi:uncharacterized membrane protein YqaE (UPF0057 family)
MLYTLAIICPPFAALIAGKPKQAFLNLILTLCMWVPGVIHAFSVIKEAQDKQDDLHNHVEKPRSEQSYRVPRVV